jgi:lycopene beta-cyclase
MKQGDSGDCYDFIFAGAGMAAAGLLLRMLQQEQLKDKKILIADPKPFAANDKTWCFWEKGQGFFENLVEKSWEQAWFHGNGFSKKLKLMPYRYKMIRSKRLFEETLKQISTFPNITICREAIKHFDACVAGVRIKTDTGKKAEAPIVFNSIPPETDKKPGHFYLLQHFTGWFIETETEAFDPEIPVLMDFSIEQHNDCRFIYLLPFSKTEALVEYTLFSENLLPAKEYEEALALYLRKAAPSGYRITERENGVIPMYSEPFPKSTIPGLVYLGTRGNQTKASTGYTFQKAQKHAEKLVSVLIRNEIPDSATGHSHARFFWFDRVLLRVLGEKKVAGSVVFQNLFRKNPVQRVFRFLDDESSPAEEFLLMNTVPTLKFILPGIKELFRKNSG